MQDVNMSSVHNQTTLSQVQIGSACTVAALHLEGLLRRRIMDLGIIPGTAIECIRKGPSGDPTAYTVRGTTIALRREDAAKINVYLI
ncbi:ferrous iron transport protein A [Dehalobacter sp. DCM]|uniref:FeoA family protein n=1 Tax=Dehalobacter sp. DCM TaxID=2907827 RepID=UPI0030815C5F|nr:ferrous iron transport protein A [Dehalobacter sp. DCM]